MTNRDKRSKMYPAGVSANISQLRQYVLNSANISEIVNKLMPTNSLTKKQ